MTVDGILGLRGARRFVVVFAVAMAAALAAATFATAVPAGAVGNKLCETNGNFCVGADNLNVDTRVVERNPGRDLTLVFQGRTDPMGNEIVKIRFNLDTTKCVAGANNGFNVVIHLCNHDGVDWGEKITATGHLQFLNEGALNAGLGDLFLCGSNNRTEFTLEPLGAGFFCAFDQV